MTNLTARHRTVGALALIAAPALSLTLMTSASATSPARYFVGQNTANGATVQAGDGSGSHPLSSQLRAVAGDGSVHVLAAKVTATRTATVLVDDATGVARIVGVDPRDGTLTIAAGNGSVVVRDGDGYALLDRVTGTSTHLAGVPAPETGSRAVTAVTATDGGAIVATADVTPAGSSGEGLSATVWKLPATGAEKVATVTDRRIVAVAATGGAVDAILAANDDDSLYHLRISAGEQVEQPMGLTLTPDVFAAELGYAGGADGSAPILTLTGANGTRIYDLDGQVLRTFAAGSRVFVSAEDLHDPQSVSNRLSTVVSLTGVRDGQVVTYGSRLTPAVSATASGVVAPSAVPAVLTLRVGSQASKGISGRSVTLTRNTCFTGSSSATVYTSAARPVTRCVDVAHRLQTVSFNKRTRATVERTSAGTLQVQVFKNRRWVTAKRVTVHAGRATFVAPRGKVRVVAAATSSNAARTLLLTLR